MMDLADKNLVCQDCTNIFLFSIAEQEFFKEKGLTNMPKRCAICRVSARYKRNGTNLSSLHDAICIKCGAPTVVPFEPAESKPVYCQACFIEVRALKDRESRLVG